MPRTTDTDVRSIIELDAAFVTTPFITLANSLVTAVCTNSSYGDDQLALIEQWLAAHFCAIRAQQIAQENANSPAGGVGASYQYKLGLILASTMYGQQAMLADYRGNLASLSKSLEEGKRKTVSISWLGTNSCDYASLYAACGW